MCQTSATLSPRSLRRPAPRRTSRTLRQARLGLAALVAALLCLHVVPTARANNIASASEGLVETGTPPFVLLRPEAMGLSAPATDLHRLPNGAILALNESELAIGDGVRWEAFQRHHDNEQAALTTVVVDRDGAIYAGVAGGIARIDFSEDGQWRFKRLVDFPADSPANGRVLARVTEVGGEWYWHNGSGPLIAWHPGHAPRYLGTVNDIECLFGAGGNVFVSDASSGALLRIEGDSLVSVPDRAASLERAITGAVSLADNTALIGSNTEGVFRFDGRTTTRFTSAGLLAGRHRINDLCQVGDGLYAAALDTCGVAFFNASGRVLQVLDRTDSHPLARVRRLIPGTTGTVCTCEGQPSTCKL